VSMIVVGMRTPPLASVVEASAISSGVTPTRSPPITSAGLPSNGELIPIAWAVTSSLSQPAAIWAYTALSEAIVAFATLMSPLVGLRGGVDRPRRIGGQPAGGEEPRRVVRGARVAVVAVNERHQREGLKRRARLPVSLGGVVEARLLIRRRVRDGEDVAVARVDRRQRRGGGAGAALRGQQRLVLGDRLLGQADPPCVGSSRGGLLTPGPVAAGPRSRPPAHDDGIMAARSPT
jgi:hypothetical protein